MIALQEQVRESIKARGLFPEQRILVAVSGGVDSIVLLQILHELSKESGWKLTIAHLNHQLRGVNSLADERLVRRTARELKLPVVVARSDVRAFANAQKLSVEMAARKLRHDFLARTAIERKISTVALAHHVDDQLELFFLRLLRGSGGEGLSGMKWSSPSPSHAAITLVRPLLDSAKETLREYAAQRGLRFREDSSNWSLDIQRNRIRHELLPLLQRKYQRGLNKSILRVMDIVGAESEFVTATAKSWLLASGKVETALEKPRWPAAKIIEFGQHLALAPFERLPVAVQRRCIQMQLFRQGIVPDYDLVEHLRLRPEKPISVSRERITSSGAGALGGSAPNQPEDSIVRCVREGRGTVRLCPLETVPLEQVCLQMDLGDGTGEVVWHLVKFTWRNQVMKGVGPLEKTPGAEVFDADKIGPTVFIRHWRPGDRFQPIGMNRMVKLQDLFVNQKVPRLKRRNLAVATNADGELFWVEGLRISERFKLTKATIRRLHWAWQRF